MLFNCFYWGCREDRDNASNAAYLEPFTIFGDDEQWQIYIECKVCKKQLIINFTGQFNDELHGYVCMNDIKNGCQYTMKHIQSHNEEIEKTTIAREARLCWKTDQIRINRLKSLNI